MTGHYFLGFRLKNLKNETLIVSFLCLSVILYGSNNFWTKTDNKMKLCSIIESYDPHTGKILRTQNFQPLKFACVLNLFGKKNIFENFEWGIIWKVLRSRLNKIYITFKIFFLFYMEFCQKTSKFCVSSP